MIPPQAINISQRIGAPLLWRLSLASFALAVLDAIGIAALLPYLALLSAAVGEQPSALAAWGERALGLPEREFIVAVTIVLMMFFAVKAIAAYMLNRVKYDAGATITCRLSDRLFRLLVNADYGYLSGRSVSEIGGVINAETVHIVIWIDAVVTIVSELLLLAAILVSILLVDYRVALVLAATFVVVGVSFYLGILRGVADHGEAQAKVRKRQYSFLFSVVTAIKDLKILGLESLVQREHGSLNLKYATASSAFNVLQTVPRTLLELMVMVAVPVVGMAAILGYVDPKSVVPILGFIAICALRLMPSYTRIVGGVSNYKFYHPSIRAIQRLFGELEQRQTVLRERPLTFGSALDIQNVSFAHGQTVVLNRLSLTIRKGTSVGFVGLSGSGKTTFLDILAGLRQAGQGDFRMDGVPFDPFHEDSLRRLIGYVPQNVILVDDTIAFNIAFEDSPDLERLKRVARSARILDFVESLDGGFRTEVGEQGVRVSGGQKQRIGICRALYRDPDILIFDEATSALDNLTEAALGEEISAFSGNKTILIVAHRLSTVAGCDVIHVFDRGSIVASGTHKQLLQNSAVYRNLYSGAASEAASAEAIAKAGSP